MSKLIKIGVGVAVATVAVLSTATARADNQSYIDELKAHGVPVTSWSEKEWISYGHRLCTELRPGFSRADVAEEVDIFSVDPVMFMDVLQHQLCPDTLR